MPRQFRFASHPANRSVRFPITYFPPSVSFVFHEIRWNCARKSAVPLLFQRAEVCCCRPPTPPEASPRHHKRCEKAIESPCFNHSNHVELAVPCWPLGLDELGTLGFPFSANPSIYQGCMFWIWRSRSARNHMIRNNFLSAIQSLPTVFRMRISWLFE